MFNRYSAGFTLLELMVAFAIAGVILAVGAPATYKLYQSAQFRTAIKQTQGLLEAARYRAIVSGRQVTVYVSVDDKKVYIPKRQPVSIADSVALQVTAAQEVKSENGDAGIRFYPDGSSTGGTISFERNDKIISLQVGWLLGQVAQLQPEGS